MLPTYEAVLQPNGQLQFFDLPSNLVNLPRRVLVTFTDDTPLDDTALCGVSLSEPALAQDWLREEEEAAWAHLQPGKSIACCPVERHPLGLQPGHPCQVQAAKLNSIAEPMRLSLTSNQGREVAWHAEIGVALQF